MNIGKFLQVTDRCSIRAHQLLALLYMMSGKKDQRIRAKRLLTAIQKVDVTNTTTIRYLEELSFLFSERNKARFAYSESGVNSSSSSCISKPSKGKVLYFQTARSLCTQQRPLTFDFRGLNSIGKRSISSRRRFSFQSFTNFASNPWRTIITLLVNAIMLSYLCFYLPSRL